MSTIVNGTNVGITRTQRRMDPRVEGEPVGDGYDRSYENPALPQISTLTLAEQSDVSDEIVAGQVWTITLTDPIGVTTVNLYTVTADDDTAGTDAEGLAYMAGVLAASIEADPQFENIVDALGLGPAIQLTWRHPRQGVWTVAAVCTPAAAEPVLLATPATPQAAGGVEIPMARAIAYGTPSGTGESRAVLPTSATDHIAGVALRDITQVRPSQVLFGPVPTDNVYPIGTMVGVREEGDVALTNQGSVAAVPGDPVHVVISTAGGGQLGQFRAGRAGVGDIWTATPTALNSAAYKLTVTLADVDDLGAMTRSFPFTADASATATEVVTGIKAAMALDLAFTARVVASGTTTLVLTGQELGVAMTVVDTQDQGAAVVGAWASIVNTTPAVPYTTSPPRWTWSSATAVGVIGTLTVVR